MNVLIIGGNGFIGSHLVDAFLKNNHFVRVFDQFSERFRKPLQGVDYILSSVKNISDLQNSMIGIDIVFHLASSSVPSTSNLDPIEDINNNLLDSLNIFSAAINAKIKRIVYFSSGGAIYDPSSLPLKEEDSLKPISSYGIVKSTVESYLKLYERMYNLETLIVRPSNPYGPRQGNFMTQGVISTFLKKIHLEEKISIFGDGNSIKDYIYIEDFVSIIIKIVESNSNGIYNVGAGYGTSINEILEKIILVTNKIPDLEYRDQQNFDIPNFVLNNDKVKSLLSENYRFTTIDEGIRRTYDWIKEQFSLIE
jgi:UDP-glucose 4-epimerase